MNRVRISQLYTALCEYTLRLLEGFRHQRDYRRGTTQRSGWLRYGFAIFTVAVTIGVRYTLLAWLHQEYNGAFFLFIIPTILTALYGGMMAGVFATFLGAFASYLFFGSSPFNLYLFTSPTDLGALVLFIVQGILLSILIETLLYLEHKVEDRAKILQESEERFRLLLEGVKDYSICMLDPRGFIMSWNQAAERIHGYTAQEIIGKHFSLFYPETTPFDRYGVNLSIALREGKFEEEGWRVRKDGAKIWANVVMAPIRDQKGRVQGFVKITRDITERKRVEDSIKYQASHDPLTKLPNRTAFETRLEGAMTHAHRNHQMLAVLFLDLDRFKSINDTLGHNTGDLLLTQVSARLLESVREEDTIARFGGDEFVVLLPEVHHPRDAVQVAKKILTNLHQPFRLNSSEVHINTSIGIAIYPQDGNDVPTLLKNADVALYQAKDSGRDTFKLYTRTMNMRASQRLSLENNLRQALIKNEFTVVYQPIINMKSGKIAGAEALIRWTHPKLGPIYPNEFIPIAEETGLILPIGEWVMGEVCRQMRSWNIQQFSDIRISVNLSARQFSQQELYEMMHRITRESSVSTEQIELEITESMAMENIEQTIQKLSLLRSAGIHSAIDDFGMGFSSLNILKQLPIDRLKIDRSFVKYCTTDSKDAAIIKAIITMAHTLKMKVVAEGIETEKHFRFLKSLNCDFAQGFYMSVPVSAREFEDMLLGRTSVVSVTR